MRKKHIQCKGARTEETTTLLFKDGVPGNFPDDLWVSSKRAINTEWFEENVVFLLSKLTDGLKKMDATKKRNSQRSFSCVLPLRSLVFAKRPRRFLIAG